MMKRIKNLKDLQAERMHLQLELIKAEETLKEDLVWFKEEMQLEKITARFFRKFLSGNKGGVLNEGVRLTIRSIVRNLFLNKAGWIVRLVVPFFISNISSGLMSEKKPEIFDHLKNLIHKIRKHLKNDDVPFDKSTADEMDY